jgi:imidazolonepropionase-like amidohydrolase
MTRHDNRFVLTSLPFASYPVDHAVPHSKYLHRKRGTVRTSIINAQIFDGEVVLDPRTVVLEDSMILSVGGDPIDGSTVVDAAGGTLLPGLFDSHVHTSADSLALALRFGITTELEMQGRYTGPNRAHITDNDAVADVRSAGFGITPPGGHPSELFPNGEPPPSGEGEPPPVPGSLVMPFSKTPDEAIAYIPQLVESGSDYIKFMIDDGTVEGVPGLPMLDQATLNAGVAEAHRHGMLTLAHTPTLDATRMAIEAGIDGLAHLFMDQAHTQEIIDLIAESGAFVVPCIVLDASVMGITGERFAADPRVRSRLNPEWLATLESSINLYPQGSLDDVLATVKGLLDADVDILAGTDVSVPMPFFGGLAHGASVHHELQMLVQAGLTPIQALRSATALPAQRFGLSDRGRIAAGLRADLLLVDGDPTVTIGDTLSIRAVWRRGVRLPL